MGYITVAEAQAVGHTADPVALQAAIDEASALIDHVTGWWFEPRTLTFTLDGSGGKTQQLHVPIIEITSIELDEEPVDPDAYVVYNRHVSEDCIIPDDDRLFPRVERRRRSEAGLIGDLYYGAAAGLWPRGQRNIRIEGSFGYTDPPGPTGSTPYAIKRATFMLLNTMLIPLGPSGSDDQQEAQLASKLKRLRTRDQEVEYFQGVGGSTGSPLGYLTGDPAVDAILARYMAPPEIRVVKCSVAA